MGFLSSEGGTIKAHGVSVAYLQDKQAGHLTVLATSFQSWKHKRFMSFLSYLLPGFKKGRLQVVLLSSPFPFSYASHLGMILEEDEMKADVELIK